MACKKGKKGKGKKIALALALLVGVLHPAFGAETPVQVTEVEAGGGSVVIQRQFVQSPINQIVKVNKAGGALIIQWNSKVKVKKDKTEDTQE
jgi:hypothetical protein